MNNNLEGKIDKITYSLKTEGNTISAHSKARFIQEDNDLKFLSFLEDTASGVVKSFVPSATVDEINTLSVFFNESDKEKKTEGNKQDATKLDTYNALVQSFSPEDSNREKLLFDDWIINISQLSQDDFKALQMLATSGMPFYNQMQQQFSPSVAEQLTASHYKSIGFSSNLQEILEKAYKAQRPVRVNLNDNTFVILRMIKNGQVSAEFIPGNKVDELFLQQNLHELKNRLEAKQLPYGELTVKQRQYHQRNKRQNS